MGRNPVVPKNRSKPQISLLFLSIQTMDDNLAKASTAVAAIPFAMASVPVEVRIAASWTYEDLFESCIFEGVACDK